jgi:hypothetical protein
MAFTAAAAAAADEACLICLDSQEDVMQMTFKCGCRAPLHEACVGQWHAQRKDICPVCRTCWHCEQILRPAGQGPAQQPLQPLEPLPRRMRFEEFCATVFLCIVIMWVLTLGILHAAKVIQ